MICLTAEEADKVRGLSPSKEGAALNPVQIKDGRFILGTEVLTDPAHEDVRDFLSALPRVPIEKLPTYGPDDVFGGAASELVVEVGALSVREPDRKAGANALKR